MNLSHIDGVLRTIVSQFDGWVLTSLGRATDENDYRNYLTYRPRGLADSPEHYLEQDIAFLDTKVGPLPTHVSIMIAAISMLVSTAPIGATKKLILYNEIGVYQALAICCLRCIDGQAFARPGKIYQEDAYKAEQEKHFHDSAIREALIKMAWFSLANRTPIALTLFLLVSTPIILIA